MEKVIFPSVTFSKPYSSKILVFRKTFYTLYSYSARKWQHHLPSQLLSCLKRNILSTQIYTWFKLLHTWRKLYQSNKVGDNFELSSHLIAGKSSPFLGWWRFLSPLHAALRPLTAEHHNNSACGMMVSYRFFGCGLTGYCWSRCSCPYCTCLFNDLHYFKVSPIQDEQLKSQPYLNLVSTEAHFS